MRFTLFIALVLSACRFDDSRPGGTPRCESNSDCPASWRCAVAFQICVQPNASDTEPPQFSNLRLTPGLARAGTELTATISVDEPLLTPALVELLFRDGTTEPFSLSDGRYSFVSDGGQREGDIRLRATGLDMAGNVGVAESAIVGQLDLSAPSVLASTQTFVSPTPAVPQVDALGIGGTAVVVARLDEPVEADPVLDVSPPGLAAVERQPTADPLQVRWQVRLSADAGTGQLMLAAELQDAAGNRSRRLLPALPYDGEAPSFSRTEDVVLEQKLQLNASQFRVKGGTTGATLVRALSGEAGFELARMPVSSDGGFDLPVANVPTMLVEAFDNAGNSSGGVRPSRIEWNVPAAQLSRGALGAVGPGLYRPEELPLPEALPWVAKGTASWERVSDYIYRFGLGNTSLAFSSEEANCWWAIAAI